MQRHDRVEVDTPCLPIIFTCSSHPTFPLDSYCVDDSTLLCVHCSDQHSSHSLESVEIVASEARALLSTAQSKLRASLAAATDRAHCVSLQLLDFTHEADRIKSLLKGQFQIVKDLLAVKEEELMRTASAVAQERVNTLMAASSAAEQARKRLVEVSDIVSFAAMQSDLVVVDSMKYVHYLLANLPTVPERVSVTPLPQSTLDVSKLAESIADLTFASEENDPGSPQPTPRNSLQASKSPLSRSLTMQKSPSALKYGKVNVSQKVPLHRSVTQVKGNEDLKNSPASDVSPLAPRTFLRKLSSSTAIQIAWTHPSASVPGLRYNLEYGIGAKVASVEQFRQVYSGPAHTCIVTDLLPKTTYRFRVAAAVASSVGDWSEVVAIATFDHQTVDPQSCGQHCSLSPSRSGVRWLTFEKAGTVTALNPVWFGRTAWEVTLETVADDGQSAVRVGVLTGKSKAVVGSAVVLKGKSTLKVRVALDADGRSLVCFTPSRPDGEWLSNLPDGPLIPALTHKPGKVSGALRVLMTFDLPYEVGSAV